MHRITELQSLAKRAGLWGQAENRELGEPVGGHYSGAIDMVVSCRVDLLSMEYLMDCMAIFCFSGSRACGMISST